MANCCIPGCDNALSPNARLRTCKNCRQNLHSWEKRPTAQILHYSHQLRLRRNRMATFAIVKDDEVTKIGRDVMEEKKLIQFTKTRRKAKSNVVAFRAKRRVTR